MKFCHAGECLPVSEDAFHCFSHHQPATICQDVEPECENWAKAHECQKNPEYMLIHCRKSCETCLDGHAGMTQIAPDLDYTEPILKHLTSTVQYLEAMTRTADRTNHHYHHKNSCVNRHPHCAYWAVLGKCHATPQQQDDDNSEAATDDEINAHFMKTYCAAACQVCHLSA